MTYKARYGQPAAACTITASQLSEQSAGSISHSQPSSKFAGSQYWRPLPSGSEDTKIEPDQLQVALHDPARAITPQQEFVMYDAEVRELFCASLGIESVAQHNWWFAWGQDAPCRNAHCHREVCTSRVEPSCKACSD